jgi:hypothetical protein
MNTKSRVVVVVKKKKNYIYSKIPRFQRFAGTAGKNEKMVKNCLLRCVALANAVKRSQIICPTSFVLFKNWNFGIFRSKVVFSSLKSRTYKIPISGSKLEQLYIRDKYWNSKLEFCFYSDSKIPISDSKVPVQLESWNK